MKNNVCIVLFLLVGIIAKAQERKQLLNFEFEGFRLNGVLDLPDLPQPNGLVLIIHGSGPTNAVAQDWYGDVRGAINKAGYGTYIWDKIGCGQSEGIFDYHQSIQSSTSEVIAAIKELKKKKIPGSEHIGLWGISRAGWIAPMVIDQYGTIKFWISVSGVDDKESFAYLFEKNLEIEGIPQDSIALLVDELKTGYQITHSGESYEAYQNATPHLRKNKFLNRFNNGNVITKDGYYAYQKTFMKKPFDEETSLQVYVEDFESVLSRIECPVLALLGNRTNTWTGRKPGLCTIKPLSKM